MLESLTCLVKHFSTVKLANKQDNKNVSVPLHKVFKNTGKLRKRPFSFCKRKYTNMFTNDFQSKLNDWFLYDGKIGC